MMKQEEKQEEQRRSRRCVGGGGADSIGDGRGTRRLSRKRRRRTGSNSGTDLALELYQLQMTQIPFVWPTTSLICCTLALLPP